MIGARDLLFAVGLPVLVGAVGVLLGRRRPIATPLALALAYVAGQAAILGWTGLAPLRAEAWLGHLALGAALLGALEQALGSDRPAIAWGVQVALALATAIVVLRPLAFGVPSPGEGALRVAAAGGAALLLARGTDAAAPRLGAVGGWLALSTLATGSAMAIALSGSLVLGQLCGVVAAATGGAAALSLGRGSAPPGGPALRVPQTLLAGLAIAAVFYSELPVASALLLAGAPWAALAAAGGWRKRPVSFAATAAGLAALVLVAAAAAWIAYRSSPPLDPYLG